MRTCDECQLPIVEYRNPKNPHAFCNRECYRSWFTRTFTGEAHYNFKGGRTLSSHGYVKVRIGPRSQGYEHRLVAERMLGRKLRRGEVVHHKDGNKSNNAPDNLAVLTNSEHVSAHHRRTACRRGHPFPENRNAQSQCRACLNLANRARRERRKEVAA